jgi:hypothetical protein
MGFKSPQANRLLFHGKKDKQQIYDFFLATEKPFLYPPVADVARDSLTASVTFRHSIS